MKLHEIVVQNAIVTALKATERDVAIAEVMDALVAAGAVDPSMREEFVKAIIARERKGSTGFGHGVAVPHVKHAAVEQMAVAVAVSEEGVDFNSLDSQPVHSIFLLLSPAERPEDHLDAMNAIFGNLQQDHFRRFLRQAKSREDVLLLLQEADARTASR